MNEYINIPKINYEGADSKNPYAFKHYNKDEIIGGKKMSEHLKFSMAYWHTICADGTDMFGVGTVDKSFGETEPIEIYKKKVYVAFEIMDKLGIEYFCFHDKDIAPEGKSLSEFQKNLDIIVLITPSKLLVVNNAIVLLSGSSKNFNKELAAAGFKQSTLFII